MVQKRVPLGLNIDILEDETGRVTQIQRSRIHHTLVAYLVWVSDKFQLGLQDCVESVTSS